MMLPPCPWAIMLWGRSLGKQEAALEVDVHDRVPGLLEDIGGRLLNLRSGTVDQHSNRSQGRFGSFKAGSNRVGLRGIHFGSHHPAAITGNTGRRLVAPILLASGDGHLRAEGVAGGCDFAPNATGAAHYHHVLAV